MAFSAIRWPALRSVWLAPALRPVISITTRRQPVHLLDPIAVVVEHCGVGARFVVGPDLVGGQAAFPAATLHTQQDTPPLVDALHAEHDHRLGLAAQVCLYFLRFRGERFRRGLLGWEITTSSS